MSFYRPGNPEPSTAKQKRLNSAISRNYGSTVRNTEASGPQRPPHLDTLPDGRRPSAPLSELTVERQSSSNDRLVTPWWADSFHSHNVQPALVFPSTCHSFVTCPHRRPCHPPGASLFPRNLHHLPPSEFNLRNAALRLAM